MVDHHRVVVVERVNASDHLVGQDTESPPVHRLAVTLVEEHLGGKVLRSAAESVSPRFAVLSETEVSELQIAVLVNENVLGLQIAIDDLHRVQVLKHQGHLRRVEPLTRW